MRFERRPLGDARFDPTRLTRRTDESWTVSGPTLTEARTVAATASFASPDSAAFVVAMTLTEGDSVAKKAALTCVALLTDTTTLSGETDFSVAEGVVDTETDTDSDVLVVSKDETDPVAVTPPTETVFDPDSTTDVVAVPDTPVTDAVRSARSLTDVVVVAVAVGDSRERVVSEAETVEAALIAGLSVDRVVSDTETDDRAVTCVTVAASVIPSTTNGEEAT